MKRRLYVGVRVLSCNTDNVIKLILCVFLIPFFICRCGGKIICNQIFLFFCTLAVSCVFFYCTNLIRICAMSGNEHNFPPFLKGWFLVENRPGE